jgi:NADH-quinone oxidoreductase subunit H
MAHLCGSMRSKYSTIAAARIVLVCAFMEVFFASALILVYAHSGGYSLDSVALGDTWLLVAIPPLGLTFGLYALFEAKRAPFDHTEAESELVAGHLVEFGGRALLLFFICEYIHVYFCLFTLLIFVCGGAGGLGTV